MSTPDYQNIYKSTFRSGIRETLASVEGHRDLIRPEVVVPTLSAAGLLPYHPDVDMQVMSRLWKALLYPDVAEMILSWGLDLQGANLLCGQDNLVRHVELCGLVAIMPSGHLPEAEDFLEEQYEGLRYHADVCLKLEDKARTIREHLHLPRFHPAERVLYRVGRVSQGHLLRNLTEDSAWG